MSSVPEHWIPFIPVRAQGSQRAIDVQRAALPRIIEGDSAPPVRVRPRTPTASPPATSRLATPSQRSDRLKAPARTRVVASVQLERPLSRAPDGGL
jgi:hypothetical protein